MSVDKFGRHSSKRNRGGHEERGESAKVDLKLTGDGDYNMQNKRIRNVIDPYWGSDVATKQYVDRCISELNIKHTENRYNMEGNRLSHLADPVKDDEAVTKGYLAVRVNTILSILEGHKNYLEALEKEINKYH